jgi:gliding motility-associated-like protein
MKKKLQFKRWMMALAYLSAPAVFAQWQDGVWVGRQAYNFIDSGIRTNFNSGTAVPSYGYPMYALEGSCTMSDAEGNLLFFAGNNTIWNANSQVMLNGSGLIGGDTSSTQFGVIVPKPGSSSIYYIFNVSTSPSTTYPNPGLVYSEIDITLDGGLGGVTENKNIVLDADVGVEKITAVYHSDGESIWVVTHRIGSNDFVAYLVTTSGIATTPVVTSIGNLIPSPDPADGGLVGYWGGAGQMKAAPDGSKIATTTLEGPNKGVDLFDFDNTTGELSNHIHLTGYNGWPYGLEFSPNSHFLYTANPAAGYSSGGTVEQYDATLSTYDEVVASKQVIVTITSPWAGNGGMVLGANGRIYIKDVGGETTNVIKNPNNAGVAAGYQAGALPMSYGIGMPTFLQTYLGSGIIHQLGCPGEDVTFSLVRIPDVTSISWNFGDPDSGAANTSDTAAHTFSAGGTYTITAEITSNGGVQTASVTITVPGPGAAAVVPQNLVLCDEGTGNGVFDLTTQTSTILSELGAGYNVNYFTDEFGAETNTGSIATPDAFTSAGQTIWARAFNADDSCWDIVSFQLEVVAPPVGSAVTGLSGCGATTPFDLTEQEAMLIGNQTGITVTYYTSEQDAEDGTNAIETPTAYTATLGTQTIYVTLENTPGCHTHTSFTVTVYPQPTAPEGQDISVCDDSTPDGFTVFNLSSQDAGYLQGQTDATVSYFTSETEAHDNVNAIATPAAYTNMQNPQVIYVRLDNGNCHTITSFELLVNSVPVLEPTLTYTGCAPFNLTEIETGINDTYEITYYTTHNDANNASNAIASPDHYEPENVETPVYVRAENASGCFTVSMLYIVQGDCIIQRGISPGNSPGYNDVFDLSNLEVTKLVVFNRYGEEVYTFNGNYTTQWGGQTNNGKELPTGTYYYMFERASGQSKTGWIYLNREN